MTDTTTPDASGNDTTPSARTLPEWMRITQHAFMRRVAEEMGAEGPLDATGGSAAGAPKGRRHDDMHAAMSAKLHGESGPDVERISAAFAAVQERATASVDADDLAATMRTLEAIARELGWSESERTGWPERGFGHGPRAGFGPGRGFGPRHGFGARHGFAAEHHADCHDGRGHRRGRGDHGQHPKRERAHERGFEAGFEAGISAAHRHQPTPPHAPAA